MKRKKKSIDLSVYLPTKLTEQEELIMNQIEKDIYSIDSTELKNGNKSVEDVNEMMFIQIIKIIGNHIELKKDYKFISGTKKDMTLSCAFDDSTAKIYYDNTYIAALFDFFYIFWTYLFKEDLVLDGKEELMYRNALNGSLYHFFLDKTENEIVEPINMKLNEEILNITNTTVRSIEIFLFLHEIAHSLEGQIFTQDLSDIDKEMACDHFALKWMRQLYVENIKIVDIHMQNDITSISPFLIFMLLDYVDRMKIKNGLKITTDLYHPTYKKRLHQINKYKQAYLTDIQCQIVDQFSLLLKLLEELI